MNCYQSTKLVYYSPLCFERITDHIPLNNVLMKNPFLVQTSPWTFYLLAIRKDNNMTAVSQSLIATGRIYINSPGFFPIGMYLFVSEYDINLVLFQGFIKTYKNLYPCDYRWISILPIIVF